MRKVSRCGDFLHQSEIRGTKALEQIAPMSYQPHRCRNWLRSTKCHNRYKHEPSKSNYPAEACPSATRKQQTINEKHVRKSSCHNWRTSLLVRIFLTATMATPPKSKEKAKDKTKLFPGNGVQIFLKIHCFSGLVCFFSTTGLSSAQGNVEPPRQADRLMVYQSLPETRTLQTHKQERAVKATNGHFVCPALRSCEQRLRMIHKTNEEAGASPTNTHHSHTLGERCLPQWTFPLLPPTSSS